jgi:hypothetical protein
MTVMKQFRLASLTKEKVVKKDAQGKKDVAHRHGVTKLKRVTLIKQVFPERRYVKEFSFENAAEYTFGQTKSRLISLLQATRLMQLQYQR